MSGPFSFILCFIVMATLHSVKAAASDSVTLTQVLREAIQNSPYAKSWQLEAEAAESLKRVASAGASLQLTADASLSRDRREALGRAPADLGTVGHLQSTVIVPFATGTTATLNVSHERDEQGRRQWQSRCRRMGG